MDIHDCIRFANENPLCILATAEGKQPRVRAMDMWFADETGFYFQTSTIKEIPSQLMGNPKVEVCFIRNKTNPLLMLRIAGEAEIILDPAYKNKVMEDKPHLQVFVARPESPKIVLFRITHGEAHFWSEEINLRPKEFIEF